MKEKISIIIPVYNLEQYISRCLDSVINQTYKNLEILVIDNNSIDNTLKICQNYASKDERIKVIQQPLQGVSHARNLGLENATGDYIGFVDGDDYIDKNMYQLLIEQLIRLDSDIVVCNAYTITDKKQFIRTSFKPTKVGVSLMGNDIFSYIYSSTAVLWNTLMRKEIVEELKFYGDIKYGEDQLFLLECLNKANSASILDKPLYYYYETRAGNLVSSNIDNRSLQFLEINLIFINFLKQFNLITLALNRAVSSVTQIIRRMSPHDDKKLTKKHLHAIKVLFKQFSFKDYLEFIFSKDFSINRKIILSFLKFTPSLYIVLYPYYKKISNQ